MATNDESQVTELRKQLPDMRYRPLIDETRFPEVVYILKTLPKLEYPIQSAGELLSKYAPAKFEIAGRTFDPAKAIALMPASYFPIASVENFAEKIGELLKTRRKRAFVSAELRAIKNQMPALRFPITSARDLAEHAEPGRRYFFRGREVNPSRAASRIPRTMFPIVSQRDFDRKISALIASRA
jgi:hypothetical protein